MTVWLNENYTKVLEVMGTTCDGNPAAVVTRELEPVGSRPAVIGDDRESLRHEPLVQQAYECEEGRFYRAREGLYYPHYFRWRYFTVTDGKRRPVSEEEALRYAGRKEEERRRARRSAPFEIETGAVFARYLREIAIEAVELDGYEAVMLLTDPSDTTENGSEAVVVLFYVVPVPDGSGRWAFCADAEPGGEPYAPEPSLHPGREAARSAASEVFREHPEYGEGFTLKWFGA